MNYIKIKKIVMKNEDNSLNINISPLSLRFNINNSLLKKKKKKQNNFLKNEKETCRERR